jgi:hypothetical protein
MLRLEASGYPIVLHVHDEIIAEVPDGVGSEVEFLQILTKPPEWAKGLPVGAKVRSGPRFCKTDKSPKATEEAPVREECETLADAVSDKLPWRDKPKTQGAENGHWRGDNGYASGERAWAATSTNTSIATRMAIPT